MRSRAWTTCTSMFWAAVRWAGHRAEGEWRRPPERNRQPGGEGRRWYHPGDSQGGRTIRRMGLAADTHAHLAAPEFDHDRDAVVERARQAGVKRILAVGTDLESSSRAVAC